MTRRFHFSQRGQELLEFALVGPILLMMLFVIIDLGRAVYYYSALHNAAREGARYGVVHIPQGFGCEGDGDVNNIIAIARQRAIGLDQAEITVIVSCNADENTISVAMTYSFLTATPFTEVALGSSSITLGTQSSMLLER